MLENKTILVTGGTGFIGSNLVRRLIQERADVHLLVRASSDPWRIKDILDHVTTHASDLSNASDVKNLVSWLKPKGIFHLGATTIMQGVIAESEKVMNVNLNGTKNLLGSITQNCEFFINTGTFSDASGSDDYAKSKLYATEFASNFGKKSGKPVVTLRLFAPYGPYIQRGRLMFTVLVDAMKGIDIKMSSPEITRDFIYIDDLVDLYFAATENAKENPGEVFDAGNGISTTLKEVADNALKITDSKSKIIWGSLAKLSYDSGKTQADIQKTTSFLHWHPKTNLYDGMQKTYDWLKENLHMYQ